VKRLSTVLSVAAIFGLTLMPSDASEGTRVTSGAMHFEDTVGGITLEGQSGFRMEAGVDVTGGVYDPWNQCLFPECQPGTEVSLFAHWIGLDLNGTVSLRGKTYVLGQEGEGGAFGSVEFDGSVILPEFTSSGTAEVSAPFLFSGQVAPDNPSGLIEFEPISGSGIATLFLSIGYDGTSWSVDRATYEFHALKNYAVLIRGKREMASISGVDEHQRVGCSICREMWLEPGCAAHVDRQIAQRAELLPRAKRFIYDTTLRCTNPSPN
jgi:hypothetical protein